MESHPLYFIPFFNISKVDSSPPHQRDPVRLATSLESSQLLGTFLSLDNLSNSPYQDLAAGLPDMG